MFFQTHDFVIDLFLDYFDSFNYFPLWNQIIYFINQLNSVFENIKECFSQT